MPHPICTFETLCLVIQASLTSLLTYTSLCFKKGIVCLHKQGIYVGYPSISCELRHVCAFLVILAGTDVTKVIIQSSRVAYKRGSLKCQGWDGVWKEPLAYC